MGLQMIEIDNGKKNVVKSGKWSDPGAKLYDTLMNAFYCKGKLPADSKELDKALKDKRYLQWYDFLKEAYLEAPIKKIQNSPYGRTPYSKSECKYPHHVIRDKKMLISIPGLQAAYKRACQTGVIKNKEVREHLERHIKELGLESEFNNKLFSWTEEVDQQIEDNFDSIFECVLHQTGVNLFDYFEEKSHGDLKYVYRIGVCVNTGRQVAVEFNMDPSQITYVGSKELYGHKQRLYPPDGGYKSDFQKVATEIDDQMTALDSVKQNIKKKGHIDHVTNELMVHSIFYRNGGSTNSVEMVPMFSRDLNASFKAFLNKEILKFDDYKHFVDPDGKIRNSDKFFNFIMSTQEFKDFFVKYCKEYSLSTEKYQVGKMGGGNKYKTTKIFWDFDRFRSYRFSPVARGFMPGGNGNKEIPNYNFANSPSKHMKESATTQYYRVTHNGVGIYEAMKKQTSADKWKKLLQSEAFTWLPKPDKYPDNYMSYFTQDGIDKFNELTLPIAEGIIGDNIKVGSFDKVDGIVYQDQFQVICDTSKAIKESLDWIEEFVNNDEFRESVVDNWEKAKTPAELLEWMDCIQYGWIDFNGNIQGTGDEDDEEDFFREYRLQTPIKLAQTRVGVCWDQAELERDWFHFHYTCDSAVMYIEIDDGNMQPTHTFLIYQDEKGDGCHWFEHSWGMYKGDHVFKNFIECIKYVIELMQKFHNDTTSPIILTWLRDRPRANSTCEQFMNFAHKQPRIDIDKCDTEMEWIDSYQYYVKDNGYEPPMPYDQLPEHLKNDPVHVWRAKTGIELIHKEPTYEELQRIWKNWQLMSDKQKVISDQKSMELFGMNNVNHYRELIKEYDIMQEEVEEFDESVSKRELKYDYRRAFDADTGHELKIIYSLDGIIIDIAHKNQKLTKEQKEEIASKIKITGDTDHQSHGQKVLAIIDLETKENITKRPVNTTGVFDKTATYNGKSTIITIKVGEIDNVPSYKSTYWPKAGEAQKGPNAKFRLSGIEHTYGPARGMKLHGRRDASEYHKEPNVLDVKIATLQERLKHNKFLLTAKVDDKYRISESELRKINNNLLNEISNKDASNDADKEAVISQLKEEQKKTDRCLRMISKSNYLRNPSKDPYDDYYDDQDFKIRSLDMSEIRKTITKIQKELDDRLKERNSSLNESVYTEEVEEYTEGSRGKLKRAYRSALDCMTGHTLSIVYELNPEMDNISGKDWYYSHPDEPLTRNRIRSEGNLDFSSSNNRVLYIKDVTERDENGKPKKLNDAYTCSIMFPIDKEYFGNINKVEELAKETAKDPTFQARNKQVYYIKVGEIDKSKVTKTTYFPKGMNSQPDSAFRNIGSPGSRPGRGVNAHLGGGHKYNPKTESVYTEDYSLETLPNKLYFASPNELKGKTISAKEPRGLFLTPLPGIASIFVIDRHKEMKNYMNAILAKNKKELAKDDYNISYYEWNLSTAQLMHPLKTVHMYHNIPSFTEKGNGTSSGYIYEIDISDVKDQLELFVTKDANREVVYRGGAKLPILRKIPWTVNWTLSYKNTGHGKGTFEIKDMEESFMYECGFHHGTGIDGDDLGWIEKYLIEEGLNQDDKEEDPQTPKEEEKKKSRPKQVDEAESNKNGVRRKKLYIAFIEWAKEFNNKNTFGSLFDKDTFNTTYPFVPEEMRYFYRLANPLLCVLGGELTFFQVSELRKLNAGNSKLNEMMIFAATPNDLRIFNKKDKKVYRGVEENKQIVLKEVLSNTFDTYIQTMIKKGDILNGPVEDDSQG